ncbi:OIT3 [Branchiostoma lanceolatum]|uniref:OIT3 protein n=1 Tax=Branchiostoma lanceolatum TaxID=7740 RepID=A0A8J9ZPN2_BRALA|nr:OIT3 [Branchiostoma lanceolatum]
MNISNMALFALLLSMVIAASAGPCVEYLELSDTWRSVNNNRPPLFCDRGLTAGWYRFTGPAGDRILTVSPGALLRCGTTAPVWMNGPHPTIADGVVTRQACTFRTFWNIAEPCYNSWNIQLTACPAGFYVYFLTPTPYCSYAYCVENVHDTADGTVPITTTMNNRKRM